MKYYKDKLKYFILFNFYNPLEIYEAPYHSISFSL